MAIRELRLTVQRDSTDVRQLQGDVTVLQGAARGLSAKVDALARLDERVTALERRLAS